MATKKQTRKRGVRGPYLTKEDQRYLAAVNNKYPEMGWSTIIRRAIRELAKNEKVA